VSDVSFRLRTGDVTCLLGPNGAGKSTVIRMLLGLTTPSSGHCLVRGSPYRALERPLTVVGSMLDGPGAHPGRTGRLHLTVLAEACGIDRKRVGVALERVDLVAAADRRVGGYSLGMRQRLGLAAALLGDPAVLVLDEPGNGLDPASQVWLRRLLREQASLGRCTLVSTHLLHEVSAVADRVLIIDGGRLVADAGPAQLARAGESLEDAYLRLVAAHADDARRVDR
jgi:ABC-2 type transport system ATP-binding protein